MGLDHQESGFRSRNIVEVLLGEFVLSLMKDCIGMMHGEVENKMVFKIHIFLMSDQIFPEFLKYQEQFSNCILAVNFIFFKITLLQKPRI